MVKANLLFQASADGGRWDAISRNNLCAQFSAMMGCVGQGNEALRNTMRRSMGLMAITSRFPSWKAIPPFALRSLIIDQSVGNLTFSDGPLAARRRGSLGQRPLGPLSSLAPCRTAKWLAIKWILSCG